MELCPLPAALESISERRVLGAITCTSAPGEGTTFTVYLKEIVLEKKVVGQENHAPLPMGTERIFFVDDEPVIAKMVEEMLGKLGYEVTTRTSSTEALEIFEHDPQGFDLIITDMTMPGMTGDKLAQKMMEIRRDMPVILCTGYSEHISEKGAKEMGIREFVMKPLKRDVLARTVRRVLDGE